MDDVTITGVRPYDGRYTIDTELEPLTTREWGWLKRLAGYVPMTAADGFEGLDPELFAVLAAVTLRRHGRITDDELPAMFERLRDVPPSAVRWRLGAGEAGDADGPPPASSSSKRDGSGDASPTSSETSPPTPPTSGTPGSATSASDPIRLAS